MLRIISLILATALGVLLSPTCNAREADRNAHIEELNDGLIAYTIGDLFLAFRILNSLAKKDVPLAQMFVGRMYEEGHGVSQNCERALEWLMRGAKGGNADAAFEVALFNEHGRCVPQSESRALAWYQLAAENGDTQAPNAIGEIYLGRGDIAPDFKKAAFWFLRGVKVYDANAYCHLGEMYARGDGVSKDLIEAYKWFHLCAGISISDQIFEPTKAAVARDSIREELMPLQVAEGQRRALEFMAKWDNPVGSNSISQKTRAPTNVERRASLFQLLPPPGTP